MTKTCCKCGAEKDVADFWKDASRRDGYSSRCGTCRAADLRSKYRENPEKARAKARAYYVRNREQKIDHARRWREANPEKATENWRRSVLKKQFGITLERYNELLAEQNHCCAICERHESGFAKRLAVDHCHQNGEVRALLCSNCNTGLGNFQDDPELLTKAAEYRLRLATGVG